MNTVLVDLTIQFLRNMEYLHLVTGTSRVFCETIMEPDIPKNFVDDVELAVSEACTNAIRHTVDADASAMVIVHFRMYETELVVEISDQGSGFEFAEVVEPAFDQHPEGGYGLYIIKSVMDEVHYTRGEEMNTLTMKKYLK